MPLIFIFIALIVAIPFLILFGLFHVATTGFEKLGLAPEAVLGVLLLMLVGSLINIPLGKRRFVEMEESHFFGLIRRKRLQQQGLSINVGGAVIPMLLVLYLLQKVPLQETLLASALMITICFLLARFVPGRGIAIPVLFPAFFATIFALVLAFDAAAPVAFISGVLGVLIGGDLLHLPRVLREGQGVMSIGGAGVFDGIFLVAIIAAFFAGL
ncbi:MAG: DUF1614 domain-containing protein [Patescibacteria group bacterium]